MQIQREDVVFAAHVHAVVVLVHAEDTIISGVQQKGEVVSRASRLQLCEEKEKKKQQEINACVPLRL